MAVGSSGRLPSERLFILAASACNVRSKDETVVFRVGIKDFYENEGRSGENTRNAPVLRLIEHMTGLEHNISPDQQSLHE